jgi:hypothetical protein
LSLDILLGNSFDSKWSNLLHYNNGDKQIISDEFYLSASVKHSPVDEKVKMIELVNSNKGFEVACNFPARYKLLQKNQNLQLKEYDLRKCTELQTFLNGFSKDNINLVFTSEYVNNPSSAFGHIMLLFTDDNKSIELGDAVHFAAKTNKQDGFFEYSYNGFSGKYYGYFIREPFYNKIYEYNTLEQRYMYIYKLDFTKEEILELLYHLFELRKARFKYYFLDGNCASRTTELLKVIQDDNIENKSFYYLPINTLEDFEYKITDTQKFIPLLNKLKLLIMKMNSEEKSLFFNIINNKSFVDKETPDIVKEAMVSYTTFHFRKLKKVYRNYNSVMEQSYQKEVIQDNSLQPLAKTKPSNLTIGMYRKSDMDYVYMSYRPLFLELFDYQNNSMQESEITTFNWDARVNDNKMILDRFDLANIKSLPKVSKFFRPVSWSLYSGFNRENESEYLSWINEFAIGKTYSFENSYISLLGYIGFENDRFYGKPEIIYSYYFSNRIKLGFKNYYKKYIKESYSLNRYYLSYKKEKISYGISLIEKDAITSKDVLFTVKYNF